MPEKYTYLLVDFFCILFPLVFSFHPKIKFYKQIAYFIVPCALTALFFVVWDILFTRVGVWSFNTSYVCGVYLAGLPVEEYLFFICIPYASVFTWYCVSSFLDLASALQKAVICSWVLVTLLSIAGLLHLQQHYTSVTFLLLGLTIALVVIKMPYLLPSFYVSYLIILLPFFLSNGILTGSLIKEPVVRYNSNDNLGIRLITIPLEDMFYGMLLILMNVAGFEISRLKKSTNIIREL